MTNTDSGHNGHEALLTVREVAELLSVTGKCVYELVGTGKLRCYRVGASRGAIRMRRADVDAYLSECRTESVEIAKRRARPRLKHLEL